MDKSKSRGSETKRVGFDRRTTRRSKDKVKDAASQKRVQGLTRRLSRISKEDMRKLAKMQVAAKWNTKTRALTDAELAKAREMFTEIDMECAIAFRNVLRKPVLGCATTLLTAVPRVLSVIAPVAGSQSGQIDLYELGRAMRKLGQDPTEDELRELIISVDEGDMDGSIDFREFLKLFAMGLDTDGPATQSNVADVFTTMGGDPRDEESMVDATALHSRLLEDFDLDVDLNESFPGTPRQLFKKDLAGMLITEE